LVNSVNEEGVLDAPGELKSIAYAQENAEFYGSEVEGVIGLLDGGSAGALDLRLFADYVRGRLRDGSDLPRTLRRCDSRQA
jgi:iron complex outermembrane receptor protein